VVGGVELIIIAELIPPTTEELKFIFSGIYKWV